MTSVLYPEPSATGLAIRDLGRMNYDDAWALQKDLVAQRVAGAIPDTILLVEHPPTITLGRGADASHVLFSEEELAARGVALREIDRGGDVTFHGPGQQVGYPIIDLSPRGRDLHRYLRDLESVLIGTLATFGLEAVRAAGLTGVWIENRKIAAIGVKVSRWVTSHGFALNIGPDIGGFQLIVPCGIRDRGVTSLSRELGRTLTLEDVRAPLVNQLQAVFG